MSVYPRKASPKRRYTDSIKPVFIPPAKSYEAQELDAISKLKDVTHSLVRELWEAGRDTDPVGQFAKPLDTPFIDPVKQLKDLEREKKKHKGYFTYGFSPAPHDNTIILKNIEPLATPTRERINKSPQNRPPALLSQADRLSAKEVTNITVPRRPSEARDNLKFMAKASNVMLYIESMELPLLIIITSKVKEILTQDDAYYEKIKNFRKLYSSELSKDILQEPYDKFVAFPSWRSLLYSYSKPEKESDSPIRRKPSLMLPEKTKLLHEPEKKYYTTGFFRINDRLFPERIAGSMRKVSDFNALSMGEMKNLAEEIPPVKVSIPFSRLTRTERVYVPHRRNSYDPHDHTDIGAYLYKGNVAHISRKQKKTVKLLASIKDVSRLSKKSIEKQEKRHVS